MTDDEAVRWLLADSRGDVYVVANGYLSRRAFNYRNSDPTFYMIGSMGLALSIGTGLAIARPDRRVVVLDGDGNLLMSLGSLPVAGYLPARRLIHIVIDNAQYASTGGQPSISGSIDLSKCALAANYRFATDVRDLQSFAEALDLARHSEGPAFIRVHTTGSIHIGPRVNDCPDVMALRFRHALQNSLR